MVGLELRRSIVLLLQGTAALRPPSLSNTNWMRSFSQALVDERLTIASRSQEIAGLLLEAAPGATALSPGQAARRIKTHLSSDEARRTRHDAVVRLLAAQCWDLAPGCTKGLVLNSKPRVLVDKPLALLDAAAGLNGKSRRVDVVVESGQSMVACFEVTVLATVDVSAAAWDRAVCAKRRKYSDLPIQPVIVAVHALSGEIPAKTLRELAHVGIDARALANAVRGSLLGLAAAPLLSSDLPDRRRQSVVHVRRKRRFRRANGTPLQQMRAKSAGHHIPGVTDDDGFAAC